MGFRRQEVYPDLPKPTKDLYVLGDSFVWGYGVGQNEIFTNHLSRLLPGWRVHNCGLAGSGTVEQYILFRHYVYESLRPGDTVVLAFFGNDFGDNIGRFEDRVHGAIRNGQIVLVQPPPPSRWVGLKHKLKDWSCLFNLVTYCIDRYRSSGTNAAGPDRLHRKAPTPEEIRQALAEDSPRCSSPGTTSAH